MSGKPESGWRWRQRVLAAALAAFLIAMPMLWMPVAFGVFGLFVWACVFVPGLASILAIQLPLKTVLLSRKFSRRTAFLAVCGTNMLVTLGVAALTPFPLSIAHIVISSLLGLAAAAIWTGLDDKALYGADSYAQGRYHA